MPKKIMSFFLALVCLSVLLFAEDTNQNKTQKNSIQHEVVVTATRLQTPTQEIASSVTVITQEELKQSKKDRLIEVLRDIFGLSVFQSGPAGSTASVSLRGANSEHTLVMIDGVEVNDPLSPSRSFDLAHLTVESVARVEILRGPQSTLYGSDAMGGVINIITQRGQGQTRLHLSSLGGSYKTYSAHAGLTGSLEIIDYSFWASTLRSEGFSAANVSLEGNAEPDGYDNQSFFARVGCRASEHIDFDLTIKSTHTKTDIDNFGGAFGDDPNNTQKYDSLFVRGATRWLFFRNRWEQNVNISYVKYTRINKNPTDDSHPFDSDQSEYTSSRWKLDWQNTLFLHKTNTLTFGVEYTQEQGNSTFQSESMWGLSSSLFPLKKAHTTGLYIQDQLKLADRFFLTVGWRFDQHSQAGGSSTYRIAPAYLIPQTGTKFKAAFGSAFKAPTLYQLYAPGTTWGPIGNIDLEPEESTSWEVGLEQNFLGGRLLLGGTYFSSRYQNLIDFDFIQGFINIARASSRGAEFLLHLTPVKNMSFQASYTRTEAKDKDTNLPLLRRPDNKFTAKWNFRFWSKSRVLLSLIHIGRREDAEWTGWTSTRVHMPPYTLLNAAFSYNLLTNIQVFLRFDNILDKEYEMIRGYGTPGFSVYGGLDITL